MRPAQVLAQLLPLSVAGAASPTPFWVQADIDALLEHCAQRGVPLGRPMLLGWLAEGLSRALEQRMHDASRNVEALTGQRDLLRQELAECRERNAPAATLMALEDELAIAGDALSLELIAFLAAMQEQQEVWEHISVVSRVKHETAMAVVRNMR